MIETVGIRERIGSRRVVASISGGKDSAAMSLYLRELGIEHDRVFMDTGWEHPATYEYLRGELTRVIGPIKEIRGPRLMEDLIKHKGMFPSRVRRFCTQELKIFPMRRYLRALADEGIEAINTVGIRGSESEARSKLFEWEYEPEFKVEVWRPILAWSEQDVIDIHRRHGLAPNPLYLRGATRVGCWPCINARKDELRLLAEIDPGRVDRLRQLEAEVAEAARMRHERDQRDGEFRPPAFFQARIEEPGGVYPCWPIDKVVEWSRTAHGGRQFELFSAPREAGCLRWGMCEQDEPTNF